MKLIYKTLSVLVLSAGVGACNSFLDKNPDTRADSLHTKQQIDQFLVQAYPQATPTVLAEFCSDNIDDLGEDSKWSSDDYLNMYYFKDVDGDKEDTPANFWEKAYRAITHSNMALKAIEQSPDPESLQAEKAEALITRAYSHFMLVNIFAKHYNPATAETDLGVVYNEGIETSLSPKYQRQTVAEVYRRIERDLTQALPYISDQIYKKPKYHFNTAAANAFAARFYLYYGKWDKAEQYANKVVNVFPLKNWEQLGSGEYEQYEEVPKQYSSPDRSSNLLLVEEISVRQRLFYVGEANARFRHNPFVAQTETVLVPSFYGPGGYNYNIGVLSFVRPHNSVLFPTFVEFFRIVDPVAQTGDPYIRDVLFSTDETLLVRAEARVMQKKYDEAARDLDTWVKAFCKQTTTVTSTTIDSYYNNIPYYSLDNPTPKKKLNPIFPIEAGTQENMIHAVLHCRRLLTLLEGMRWYDIKRYGIEIPRRVLGNDAQQIETQVDFLTKDDPRRALQIPKQVIKAGMQPNPR